MISCYILPLVLPISLWLELDPLIHAAVHINRFIPYLKHIRVLLPSKLLCSMLSYLARYFLCLLGIFEIVRMFCSACIFICFGARMINQVLAQVRSRVCGSGILYVDRVPKNPGDRSLLKMGVAANTFGNLKNSIQQYNQVCQKLWVVQLFGN